MTPADIRQYRLQQQQISQSQLRTPTEVVHWFGAMQAQEFANSRWAIGLRLPGTSEAEVQKAFDTGKIVRSWAMRGTIHNMAPADIRWILDLLGEGVCRKAASRHRQLELDDATLNKSVKIMEKALEGGKHLTRTEIFDLLEKKGIATKEQRGVHIINHAALHQHICFGKMKGKQPTFTLLDEWIPRPANDKELSRAEALAKLALRYYTSHGPATIADYANWAGVGLGEAKAATEAVRKSLSNGSFAGTEYFAAADLQPLRKTNEVYLLPAFDEYGIGYKDRSAILEEQHFRQVFSINGIFFPIVVVQGKVWGTWKRSVNKKAVDLELSLFSELNASQLKKVKDRMMEFAAYLGVGPGEVS